jgi:CubicO group peptidase (beta-lactamase class C family)
VTIGPPEAENLCRGGGLYGTTRDYLKVLQAVLKSDPNYVSNVPDFQPLLSRASFKALFTGVLPQHGVSELGAFLDIIWYHKPNGRTDEMQHSPGMLLYPDGGHFGRKPGSGSWDGALKTAFWIDPQTGIAVSHFPTNISPNQ